VLPPCPLLPRRCLSTWSEKRVVLNLLLLSAGPYLESCLEESQGWVAAAGWCRTSTECRAPLPLATLMASAAVDPTALGVPSWDIPTAALVTSMSWAPATLAMLAHSRFVRDRWRIGASALDEDCRCGLTLTLGVNTKLGTLSLSEGIFSHEFMTSWVAVNKPFSRASFRSLWNNLLEPYSLRGLWK